MNDVCTHLDQILITDMPASVEGIDQVGFRVDGIHGNTHIPPSPMLQ